MPTRDVAPPGYDYASRQKETTLKSTARTSVRRLPGGTYRIRASATRSAATGRFVTQATKKIAGTKVTSKTAKVNPVKAITGKKVKGASMTTGRKSSTKR
ncbi:hypothetical protein MGAD_02120 [Mycolicibacterium gadium]|uniref:Uncharacterized protein n=1 Tax=Mycolicibacterium gadium TaxID=1794 RepID=A0A7I7WGA4_MYCGU|nr:hypothetical protein MGAD_02120 [Mycolicibacterium gadium]